jgi:hypothetical protein
MQRLLDDKKSVGHVTEMTGHVPEFGGHDAEKRPVTMIRNTHDGYVTPASPP